jgi:hypothetical protein
MEVAVMGSRAKLGTKEGGKQKKRFLGWDGASGMEGAALVHRRIEFTSQLEWKNGRQGPDEDRVRVTRETLDLTKERLVFHFLLIDLILGNLVESRGCKRCTDRIALNEEVRSRITRLSRITKASFEPWARFLVRKICRSCRRVLSP